MTSASHYSGRDLIFVATTLTIACASSALLLGLQYEIPIWRDAPTYLERYDGKFRREFRWLNFCFWPILKNVPPWIARILDVSSYGLLLFAILRPVLKPRHLPEFALVMALFMTTSPLTEMILWPGFFFIANLVSLLTILALQGDGSDRYKVVVLFAGSILLLGSYQFNQLLLILVPVLFLGERDLNRKKFVSMTLLWIAAFGTGFAVSLGATWLKFGAVTTSLSEFRVLNRSDSGIVRRTIDNIGSLSSSASEDLVDLLLLPDYYGLWAPVPVLVLGIFGGLRLYRERTSLALIYKFAWMIAPFAAMIFLLAAVNNRYVGRLAVGSFATLVILIFLTQGHSRRARTIWILVVGLLSAAHASLGLQRVESLSQSINISVNQLVEMTRGAPIDPGARVLLYDPQAELAGQELSKPRYAFFIARQAGYQQLIYCGADGDRQRACWDLASARDKSEGVCPSENSTFSVDLSQVVVFLEQPEWCGR
jgi:hypothetical protein